jgi:hypothetical protein
VIERGLVLRNLHPIRSDCNLPSGQIALFHHSRHETAAIGSETT